MAKNSFPEAMPNPAVGAILVHNNSIIAEGYTSAYGGAHAEVNCIVFAKANTPQLIAESTLYVTLEPCSHYGKTPPCADLVIASGIKRVLIGTIDPHSKVAGKGIQKLMEAGIDVTVGILEKECMAVNARFFTYHEKKRPYIILKWAETQDGFIAPKHKEEQKPVWITNTASRQLVHKWRSQEQAILIGGKTAIDDNPSLTTRDWHGASPIRIVLDTRGNLPASLKVFDDTAKTIKLATANPAEICDSVYAEGIQSVVIEGGAQTLQKFIDANLWDEARVFKGVHYMQEGIKAPAIASRAIVAQTQNIQGDVLTTFNNPTS